MSDLQEYIGKKLKYHRQRKGLSKEQFAKMTGVSSHTITNYEEGKTIPNMDFMINVSKALNVSVDRLLFEPVKEERYLSMEWFSDGVHVDEEEKQRIWKLFKRN